MRFALAVAVVALLSACTDAETRTQISFNLRLEDSALQAQVEKLEVRIRSERKPEGTTRTFPRAELKWPVEIVVVPEGANRTNRRVTLLATAYDGDGRAVVHWDETREFAPRMPQVFYVNPMNGAGPSRDAGGEQPPIDGGGGDGGVGNGSDSATQSDASSPEGDASDGPANCMTEGAGIRCDDKNPCNGTERCEPDNAGADEKGCVPGSDAPSCVGDTVCDRETGKCSRCSNKPDGDGDGVASIACGGTDCDDNDDTVAPGKPEICDGKDNDCDKVVDGPAADATCVAPRGGTATCEGRSCLARCDDPNQQIENNVCVAPIGTCPIINPCAPGRCIPNRGGYTCNCPNGFRAGLTRCAASGAKRRTIGFDQTCDGMSTPGEFTMGAKTIASTLFAGCGVASLSATGLQGQVQLFEASESAPLEQSQGPVLEGTQAAMTTESEIIISFAPAVNDVSFTVLDLDDPTGVRVLVEAPTGADLLDAPFAPAQGSRSVSFTYSSVRPIARVSVRYTPTGAEDRWFLEDLAFDVRGCGDGEADMGEACDDGNSVQCDGCDNACMPSPTSC